MKIPPSGKRGLALILTGVVCFAGITGFMATRNFEPVSMPVSLLPGHFSTGDFQVSTEGTYEAVTYGGQATCESGAGDNFRAKWALYKEGRIVSEGTTTNWWFWAYFNATEGTYRLDVDIVSSPICLNSGAPHLYVSTYEAYSRYNDMRVVVVTISFVLVAVGLMLLIRSYMVPKLSRRQPAEPVISDGQIQYPRPDPQSRFPLNRRFSGLPSYGVVATLVMVSIFLPYWVLYSWFDNHDYKGHYVRLTKPRANPALAGIPQQPIIVRVQRTKSRSINPDRPELYLNSQSTTWDELGKDVRAELSGRADRVVYIAGDENLAFQDIAQVVDITREAWPDVPIVLWTPDMDDKIQELYKTVYKNIPDVQRTSFRSDLEWMISLRKARNWDQMFSAYDNEQQLMRDQFISQMKKTADLVTFEPSTVKYFAPNDWRVEGCALFSPSPIKNDGVVATVNARRGKYSWQFTDIEVAWDKKKSARPCKISR